MSFARTDMRSAMSTDLERNREAKAQARGVMPPYLVRNNFLPEQAVVGLLDYASLRQADFKPTGVTSAAGAGKIDPAIRVSTALRQIGPYRDIIQSKILNMVPALIDELRVTPFEADELELELVAHGDGAHYRRHNDLQTRRYNELDRIRALSGVYYFHASPKAFTGGALRLYAIGGKADEDFVDLEPTRNSLVVFPSWAPHEVMSVSCPSKRFIDSRFAINCWMLKRKPAAEQARVRPA